MSLQSGRQLHHAVGRHRDALARRAVARIAGHALARLDRGDALPHRLDGAGKFRRRRERQLRLGLVPARDDQRVEEVERRRFDADDHLAGSGNRVGQVVNFEVVRSAEAGAYESLHGDPAIGEAIRS